MSMLSMRGKFINSFETPKGEKEGKEFGGQHKVQILGSVVLPNGESKNELVTLTCHSPSDFDGLEGLDVLIPVGVFSSNKSLTFYIPKGSRPELVS